MSDKISDKIYNPPASAVQGAHVSGMAAYEALCQEADTDYAGFWARQARELLSWQTPFTQALDESDAPFFKWFADGLFDGSLGFGGEESAGASFLRKDGGVWSTDKDGIILNLLVDENVQSLGHRRICLGSYEVMAPSCQPHKAYGSVAVLIRAMQANCGLRWPHRQ